MNVLPVIARELRAEARHGFTYGLRVLGAAVMLGVGTWAWMSNRFGNDEGAHLFAVMHVTLLFSIWILVPLMTADCISREKREETIGLLFLTPLSAQEIVIGKSLIHAGRALTLLLAVVPVMVVPVLLGGVSWVDGMIALVLNLAALALALAAGLVGSVLCRQWLRAAALAEIFSAASVLLYCYLMVQGLGYAVFGKLSRLNGREGIDDSLALGWGMPEIWSQQLAGMSAPEVEGFYRTIAGLFIFCILALVFAMLAAARHVAQSWQEKPPSIWRQWLRESFCTPVLGRSLLRRWMQRKIERNPIGWLEQRTWSGRLVSWSWLAIMVCVLTWVLEVQVSHWGDALTMLAFMSWPLAGSMAFTAAGSFRRERESGVLELLLVSPVSERQIIGGRLRGLWGQFLPAVVLLFGIWVYFVAAAPVFLHERSGEGWRIVFHAVTILTVPVVGLYYSLRCRHVISAFLATLALGIVVPAVVPWVAAFVVSAVHFGSLKVTSWPAVIPWPMEIQEQYGQYLAMFTRVFFAVYFFHRLQRSLTRRTFAFQQGRG